MRRIAYFLMATLVVSNYGSAQLLPVNQKYQEQSQWCWAATSQAVLEYYSISRTQTEIAQYGTDGANIWNWLYGSSTSPTRNGVVLILNYFGSISSTAYAQWFTYEFICSELGNQRPIPIRWAWDGGGGHILVIHGAVDNLVYLMDPWYGPTINSYTWVREGSSHTWTHSLGLNTAPLPVELTSFTASTNNLSVELQWQTETEVNNYGFEIERSLKVEDEVWEKRGFVEGHGNSNSPKQYSFTDKNLIGGSRFSYRLKQIDNDGKFEYSDEIEVVLIPTIFELAQNYPNPFNPVTIIRYQLPTSSKVTLKIYDVLGNKVITMLNEEKEAGTYEFIFDASNYSSGVYFYRIQAGSFATTKKMVLLR